MKLRTLRKIVKLDEEKCDGCGLCVLACAEGAIQVIDGKARLVSEKYCDGLEDCVGECPQGAITIEEREAEEFDPEAVRHHLASHAAGQTRGRVQLQTEPDLLPCGCPSTTSQVLPASKPAPPTSDLAEMEAIPALLGNWPVQIRLVAVDAPYFHKAKLLISADCVPFAFADFHRQFLGGHILLVGCPKLDDAELYRRKLAQIFSQNNIQAMRVTYMEVPCCFGLVQLVNLALDESGKKIPLTITKIDIRGTICETTGPQG